MCSGVCVHCSLWISGVCLNVNEVAALARIIVGGVLFVGVMGEAP